MLQFFKKGPFKYIFKNKFNVKPSSFISIKYMSPSQFISKQSSQYGAKSFSALRVVAIDFAFVFRCCIYSNKFRESELSKWGFVCKE